MNKVYFREKFFTFKMDTAKSLSDNLDEFKKISADFNNLEEKTGAENEAVILLNSVSRSL